MSGGISSENKFSLWGWFLFLIFTVLFVTAATEDGNILNLIGSIIFLIACLIFIASPITEKN